ncbi:MAG: NAD(P)-dependent alcohol dehydrogenase [Verrucomicrobiota bacterium]
MEYQIDLATGSFSQADCIGGPIEPGHVGILLQATSLNYRDLLVRDGKSASGGSGSIVPLSDGAGEIYAVGEGVTDWQKGDRVALTFFRDWEDGRFDMKYHKAARGGSCNGVLSQYTTAKPHELVRIPSHLDYEAAATLPCAGLTAWHALMERSRRFSEGDTLLCLGTGGVSLFGLQIAKAVGARVIITSSSDEKLERAKELGADEVINYRENPDWDKEVYQLTEKRGVDHVLEVGGPGTLEKSMNATGPGGSISMIGVLTGFDAPSASLFPIVSKNINLEGIYVGSRAMFERFVRFVEEHAIEPVIDRTFSFMEASDAYDYLESGAHFGKVVISTVAAE